MAEGGEISPRFAGGSPQSEEPPGIELVGVSSLFRQVLSIADVVANNDSVVLLEGESGTGKELLARRIHSRSSRSVGPLIPVNCPAVSESLFESQFYGHMRGAFTGAAADTLGMVRAAEGGSLFLDEVGELPLHLQSKLLRLLQEREVTPVGAARPVPVDVRFIAATNRNLTACVVEGKFRSDLYHRLNVVRIEIPPLRSRPEDIEPLLDYYNDFHARCYRMPGRFLGKSLRRALRDYPWPGNVRELCSYVERLYAADLPPMPPELCAWEDGYERVPRAVQPGIDRIRIEDELPVCCSLAEAEAKLIRQALYMTGYNRSAAARTLGIHRSTLLRKMRFHGLAPDENAR